MTLEEAKNLKQGDRVLVEMEVCYNSNGGIIDEEGDIWFRRAYAKPESIREKLAPPRRKFKEGDIVRYTGSGTLTYVCRDEFEDGSVFVGGLTRSVRYVFLELICAVENREDRPAAEEGGAA